MPELYFSESKMNLIYQDVTLAGVLGTAAGLTGLIVAQTTINFFTNKSMKILNKLIMINSKSMQIDLY